MTLAPVHAEAERQRMATEIEDARVLLMSAAKRASELEDGVYVHLYLAVASVDAAREKLAGDEA